MSSPLLVGGMGLMRQGSERPVHAQWTFGGSESALGAPRSRWQARRRDLSLAGGVPGARAAGAARGWADNRAARRAAAATLSEALALWRGPPLADVADELEMPGELARLEEMRLTAIEDRVEAELALGKGAELVAELKTHVSANPLRERLRGQLMLAL